MKIISRIDYAQMIDAWLGKELIIVLVGQRRVGKSYMLKDFFLRHCNEGHANIIYIDKEKKQFDYIKTNTELNDYIDSHFDAQRHNYILIDEVQDIDGWEHSVRSYRSEENVDIIVTGSNSKMLSSELSTLIGGRYKEIHIQGLSYNEFLQFHQLMDSDDTLWKYLNYGGLPGLRAIGIEEEEMVHEYLYGVFNTVMLKDVIERHNIRNIPFLNNFISYLADTIGKLCSASSISKYLKSQQQDVSTNAILNYASFFTEAFLTYAVGRYDIHGKRLLESNGKNYFGDLGLRNLLVGGERKNDIEKVIENAVYLHLLRLGYVVYVGQFRVGEVDFVCEKHGNKAYVQVTYLVDNEDTEKREFGTLRNIPDDYPKYVISLSPMLRNADYGGIRHIHLREFLKNGLA